MSFYILFSLRSVVSCIILMFVLSSPGFWIIAHTLVPVPTDNKPVLCLLTKVYLLLMSCVCLIYELVFDLLNLKILFIKGCAYFCFFSLNISGCLSLNFQKLQFHKKSEQGCEMVSFYIRSAGVCRPFISIVI